MSCDDIDALTEAEREAGLADDAPPAADIAALAKLDPIEYDRWRKAEAERLGVRAITLDEAVKAARRQHVGDRQQRETWQPRRAEPCNYKVDGAATLAEMAAAAQRYLHLPRHGETILALWIAHTYCFDAQPHTPRLAITSATRGCGKTAVLGFLRMACQSPLNSDNATAAAIFRLVEQHRATLLLDELDGRFQEADDLRSCPMAWCN